MYGIKKSELERTSEKDIKFSLFLEEYSIYYTIQQNHKEDKINISKNTYKIYKVKRKLTDPNFLSLIILTRKC